MRENEKDFSRIIREALEEKVVIKKRTLTKSDILRKDYPSIKGTYDVIKELGRLG